MNPKFKAYLTSGGFAFLTLISIGGCTACLGYIYDFLIKIHIKEASSNMHVYALIACIFSALIFAFSIVAPCFNNRGLRLATSIIYIVYEVIIIAAIVAMHFFSSRVYKTFKPIWNDQDESHKAQYCKVIDRKCCGWNITKSNYCNYTKTNATNSDCATATESCKTVITDLIGERIGKLTTLFIVIAIILFLGIFVALFISCSRSSDSGDGEKARESMNTPLTYGW